MNTEHTPNNGNHNTSACSLGLATLLGGVLRAGRHTELQWGVIIAVAF